MAAKRKQRKTTKKSSKKRKVTTETAETEQPETKQPKQDEELVQDVAKSEEKVTEEDQKPGWEMTRTGKNSTLKGSVYWSTHTGMIPFKGTNLSVGHYITMVTNILGQCHLIQYDLQGEQLQTAKLKHFTESITEATLAGKQCLAVSYGLQAKNAPSIEFLDLRNLKKKVFVFATPAHKPHSLVWIQPSTLMYQDYGEAAYGVRSLDCSTFPLKPTEHVTSTGSQQVTDMCCVQHGDEQLIVATMCRKGLYAFSTRTNRLVWKVEGKPPGVGEREIGTGKYDMRLQGITTDGRGHLFVCDHMNNSIQMFSMDGEPLGSLPIREHLGIELGGIRWSEETLSLTFLHWMLNNYQTVITSMKVQQVD